MSSPDPVQIRDAGLRKVAVAKRWILAGSVTLTGALAAVAANSFPGKSTTAAVAARDNHSVSETGGGSSELGPPTAAPESGETQQGASETGSETQSEAPVISGGS